MCRLVQYISRNGGNGLFEVDGDSTRREGLRRRRRRPIRWSSWKDEPFFRDAFVVVLSNCLLRARCFKILVGCFLHLLVWLFVLFSLFWCLPLWGPMVCGEFFVVCLWVFHLWSIIATLFSCFRTFWTHAMDRIAAGFFDAMVRIAAGFFDDMVGCWFLWFASDARSSSMGYLLVGTVFSERFGTYMGNFFSLLGFWWHGRLYCARSSPTGWCNESRWMSTTMRILCCNGVLEIPNFFRYLVVGRYLELTWVTSFLLWLLRAGVAMWAQRADVSMPTRGSRRCCFVTEISKNFRLSFGWNLSLRFWIYKRNSHYLLGATLS